MPPKNRLWAKICIGILVSAAVGGASLADTAGRTQWRTLRIGAGGFITGLDASPDGSTRLVRTDTYGAYIWDVPQNQWKQLVTSRSMPPADLGVDKNSGVYEIRVAPNLPTRLYMAYRGNVYRSNDRGGHWIRTAFANVQMSANDDFRTFGQKMAVDPANPDVVYLGTPANGIFFTNDGGATWRPVAPIPKGETSDGKYPGHAGIAFDPSSRTSNGRKSTIYISSYRNGVYQSVDAGASWRRLTGGPTNVSHGKCASDGAYYVTGDDGHSVWRYQSGAWANITPPDAGGWDTVAIDPFDPSRILAVRNGGYLDISHDRGATWGGIIYGPGYNHRVANDIPWLAWTNEIYMSTGDMAFDPVVQNRLWFAEGIGVWFTDLKPNSANPKSITFTSQSRGIEQLVADQILAPPGGKPVVASWDRPVFYVNDRDEFPLAHGPDNQHAIVMGWALDYASSKPDFVVGLMDWWGIEDSGYSNDGGRTWRKFDAHPDVVPNKIGGGIAASTPENIVWAPSNNATPYYTNNGGATWLQAPIPGAPTSGETGWGFAYYLNRHIVAADRVALGTFYIYNTLKGLYRSIDGGATWTLVHVGEIAPFSGFNATLETVPGQKGHLFFSSGPQAGNVHPAANPFMRSTDGGVTWSVVPGVLEVRAFGFGKPTGEYPTIFICGWVRGIYGIWRSNDNARSWTKIGTFPLDSLDDVRAIDGDKNVQNLVYVGFAGSGYAYGADP
jgi:hypothetical protein